ncbi:MAG TPA: RDD family protein [Kofleriaceae bacterium]
MSEREPAVLRDEPAAGGTPSAAATPPPRPSQPMLQRPASKREAPSVYVVGFWKRFAAAMIDFFIILPVAILITFIVSKIADVHLPAKNIKLLDIDMWIDLVLATNSALVMALVLFIAIALTYLLVFHITLGRTLGMRVLKMKIIDIYGDPPSPARCVARCAGYLAGIATLFLGFLWIGFDNEKRGLQDWIAGTYVIRV